MKRSKMSLSHTNLLSCDAGELIPCGLMEVLPGDSIQLASNLLVRASPLLAPIMHPVHVRVHHWFVPHRLVWEDWEDFITGGPDNEDASVFPTMTFATPGVAVGSLADYYGLPLNVVDLEASALPIRGYNLIFNEWYRDQDLQNKLAVSLAAGADTTTARTLQNIAWEKDYFTAARPWEQKGPSITIPIGDTAPVRSDGGQMKLNNAAVDGLMQSQAAAPQIQRSGGNWGTTVNLKYGTIANPADTGLEADLSSASAITLTALREASALQRYSEARARYGSRYVEYLRYLGVRSADARLQRPEYLGGGRQTLQFSEVLQTAEGTNPVGSLRGHGITGMRSNRFRRFFEEHGYIHSFLSIRPKTMYMQGLDRTWNRRTKEDFFQHELQHIGQQEVLNKEIYAAHTSPNGVFGYSDRYAEYRTMNSRVSGEFRTTDLNFWHMARDFSGDPALNAAFIQCVPTERTFAVPSKDVYWIMCKHSAQARRLVTNNTQSFLQ